MVTLKIEHCDDDLFNSAKAILRHNGFGNIQPEFMNRNKGTMQMAGVDEAYKAISVLNKYKIPATIGEN